MLRASTLWHALPSDVLRSEVASGRLRPCAQQTTAARQVDRLYNDLVQLTRSGVPSRDLAPISATTSSPSGGAGKRGSIKPEKKSFFSSFIPTATSSSTAPSSTPGGTAHTKPSMQITHPLSKTCGIYLFGDVGCGKTHIMDLFYHELPTSVQKRRVHFHQFMQMVHKDMHRIKQEHGKVLDGDQLMREVAKKQCDGAELLCFDELVVTDVADAMILRRLFENMYAVGICTIFTSNRKPAELYLDGLNREAFLPFIDLVHQRCHVHDMASGTDHRLVGTVTDAYLYPVNAEKTNIFNAEWRHATAGDAERPVTLRVYGRDFVVRRAANGACRFTFRELCNADTGVADFSALAKKFHTIFIEDVPQLPPGNSDTKRRFIGLLDELYQYRVKVHVLANVPLEQLEMTPAQDIAPGTYRDDNEETFYAGQLIGAGEDKFQMRRAISRLQEMRTKEYAKMKHLAV